jgi:uncharacterized protein YbbC (DUF1343 family)/CubicO group peptidase (beta-lactamase class C family)
VDRHEIPGVVVLVVHRDQIVYRKAFGLRSVVPNPEPMTPDTIFDLASLTKPVATATSIHLLAEQGKLRLDDPVVRHWPEFAVEGKQAITIEHLLLHTSGLPASIPLLGEAPDAQLRLARVAGLRPTDPAGVRWRYSDAGYAALAEIVRRVSGQRLDAFFSEQVAQPLGLKDTGFLPPRSVVGRIAPTEKRNDRMLRGAVHDPSAARMEGVAGHAGLFATADDLALYCRMLMGDGEVEGRRLMQPATVRAFLRPHMIPGGWRALGWDMNTGFSWNRGTSFPLGGVGHTGFTGTSIWIDRASRSAVIVLASRLHPQGEGNVVRLRGEVATIVGKAVQTPVPDEPTLTGIDVLEKNGFEPLRERHVGLVTNATGVDREGKSTIDVLRAAPGVTLVALFSPEHGLRGGADVHVGDSTDDRTGLPVYSLYGPRNKPSPDQLKGVDTLVFDVQTVGVRFFTYGSTLGYLLEAAAQARVRLVVLDRPEPTGARMAEGPVAESGSESFTCYHAVPIRYGLTSGELALLLNDDRKIGADLSVVRMQGWRRGDPFEDTGLTWRKPSPNLPTLQAARLYAGVALLEPTNVSVGRGTDLPFQWVGAPWLSAARMAETLERENLPGVHFVPWPAQPSTSAYAGQMCQGVRIVVVDPRTLEPVKVGFALARALMRVHPQEWDREQFNMLLASATTAKAIEQGATLQDLETSWQQGLATFESVRKRHLLYEGDGAAR